jgi:hypothetical protein
VLTKFALIFAAVRLARYWKILPSSLPGKAVLTVYQRHLAQRPHVNRTLKTNAIARVREYVQRNRPQLIDLSKGYPALSDKQFKEAPGFLRAEGGSEWLLIGRPRWAAEFLLRQKDMLEELKAENRLKTSRGEPYQWQTKVRQSKKTDRVYAIKIE